MKPIRTTIVTAVAALIVQMSGCAGEPVRESRTSETQVRMLVDQFLAAVNGADTKTFMSFFANEATAFLPTNAARRVGIDEIEAAVAPVFAQGPRTTPATPRDLRIAI